MKNKKQYLLAGWLFDGTGRNPLKNVLLEITDGRFTAIEPRSENHGLGPDRVTDFSGCCVLPPFIDSHVHLCMSGTLDRHQREQQLVASHRELEPVISSHIEDHLRHGVIAVRDGGDRLGSILGYRQSSGGSRSHPLVIKTPGRAWHCRGRYGSLIGRAPLPGESLAEAISRDRDSADHLKLVNSGLNSLTVYQKETRPQFSCEDLKSAVREARRNNQKVMVHANGEIPVQTAVQSGCDSVEHGFFMGEGVLNLMAEKRTFWVPTIFTMRAYLNAIMSGSGIGDSAVVERTIEHQINQLSLGRKRGVKVAVGTDSGSSGVFHGASFVQEMHLFAEAGYSVAEIIKCASSNGAEILGIGNEYGPVIKGRPAHFLTVQGTPSDVLRNIDDTVDLYINGTRV